MVGCGYCWHSIGEAPPVAAAVVASELYRDVAEQARMPVLARAFFCAALVAEAAEEIEASAWTFMYAAWACDDGRAMVQARRERAVEMFRRGIERGELSVPASQAHTLVAEVLRRAGRFEDAVAACDEAARARSTGDDSGDDDADGPSPSIDAFIRSRAEARDDRLYTVAEAFAHED